MASPFGPFTPDMAIKVVMPSILLVRLGVSSSWPRNVVNGCMEGALTEGDSK